MAKKQDTGLKKLTKSSRSAPQFSQKWCLVSFFERVPEGFEFHRGECPLHVTLADTFAAEWKSTGLFEELEGLLTNQKSLKVVASDDATFGPPNEPVKVTILDKTAELQLLHERIIKTLKSAGAVFNNPQYVGPGYSPHSTVQKHARLHKDDTATIDSVTLIDMFPNGDAEQRRVLGSIKFA